MRDLIIDMRCLQDVGYAERGIAAHSRSAILQAREVSPMARAARIIGIVDQSLPPLPDAVAAVADVIRPNAYWPQTGRQTVFVNPSPMSPDQSFVSRLLLARHVRKAAFVYDFIPFDEPERYLASPATRLDYHTAIAWLNRYDLFLPISEDSKARLAGLYRLDGRAAAVTGVPLAPWLENSRKQPALAKHILVVAGDDARKNPELVVRAHAASRVLQEQRIPLIITGNYAPSRQAQFRALAAAHGGAEKLILMPGRVTQEVLQAQYRNALCVVTASRAEGFSMPVIEAMAAGVPSIVSDIPVHAALVKAPVLRFGTDDDVALTALMERLALDPAFRQWALDEQEMVWPQFRARDVAAKLWSAVEAMLPAALPRISTLRRPRIAMLTPLPPVKSGVADYSASLATALGQHADVSVFTIQPARAALPASGLPHVMRQFDRVVSVMGNSTAHNEIYDLQMRYGGACICHDARLLGFSIARNGMAATALAAGRELGRKVNEAELELWTYNETKREANFLSELADTARPLIFHARHSVTALKQQLNKDARYLPFAIYRPWSGGTITPKAKAEARARLGLDQDERLIASFGFINYIKGIKPALRALALLRDSGFACRLIWAGEPGADLPRFRAMAAALDVADCVTFQTSFLSESSYRDHLLAADCGLQLRAGGKGNISGALQDCIAAGLPSVANDDLAENLDAPSFVRRVPDRLNPTEISNALRRVFVGNQPRNVYEPERAAYCDEHSMARYASSLCATLEL